MHGVERKLKGEILALLESFPAVALLGPRQCGKTTLAHEIAETWSKPSHYLDLERVADNAKLDDCVGFLEPLEGQLVILDEVQARPSLFPELRGLIDSGRRKGIRTGRFLFLGSASYELLQQSGESLAGRIAYRELTPFKQDEVAPGDLDQLWLRGGFPDSFLAPSEMASREWRRNFVDTYLAKDLGLLQRVGPLPAMRDLLQMTGHLHGQILNISQLVRSHEFSRPAISSYLDLFEQTFVIRRLKPYFTNVGKRLTKSPKIYLRDSGLLHQLMGISDDEQLRGHPIRGASWEGFVIEQITSLLPDWTPYFYRTSHGAELDLILTRGTTKIAFEIKVSTAPSLTKGFYTAVSDVRPDKVFVISRTNEVWTTQDDVTHAHLGALGELLIDFKQN